MLRTACWVLGVVVRTIEAKGHFCLERLEVFRHARFGLATHLLASPLEGAIKFLCEIHVCVLCVCVPSVVCASSASQGTFGGFKLQASCG